MPQYPDHVLHGRAGELAAINRLLERAREGYSEECSPIAESNPVSAHFEEALRLLPSGLMPFWRARIQLGYGEQLRRARHRSQARSHLREARESFELLGA